jgi:hypothetical protein
MLVEASSAEVEASTPPRKRFSEAQSTSSRQICLADRVDGSWRALVAVDAPAAVAARASEFNERAAGPPRPCSVFSST